MSYLKYLLVLVILCLIGLVAMGVNTKEFEYDQEMIVPGRFDSVWTDITLHDSLILWYPDIKQITMDSGLTGYAPVKYTWTMLSEGKEIEFPVEMTEMDRNDSVTYVLHLPEFDKKVTWSIKGMVNFNTAVKGSYTLKPNGFFNRIFYSFNSLNLSYQDLQILEALRDRYREKKKDQTSKK